MWHLRAQGQDGIIRSDWFEGCTRGGEGLLLVLRITKLLMNIGGNISKTTPHSIHIELVTQINYNLIQSKINEAKFESDHFTNTRK